VVSLRAGKGPSLFTYASAPMVAELDVASRWNRQAKVVLENHWDAFIAGEDFEWLGSVKTNTVRLPLGYWHNGTDANRDRMQGTMFAAIQDQHEGAWSRVLQTISWTAGYDILIDFHGAPGSQNGMSLIFSNTISDTLQVETIWVYRIAKSTCFIQPTICARRSRCSNS
jgi:aryl-phospho-beta-D-glucosidase BglC (GH1 family)